MYTIHIDEIEEGHTENIEIWVAGSRRITVSINKHDLSLQIPGGVKQNSIANSPASFYARSGYVNG